MSDSCQGKMVGLGEVGCLKVVAPLVHVQCKSKLMKDTTRTVYTKSTMVALSSIVPTSSILGSCSLAAKLMTMDMDDYDSGDKIQWTRWR
ncbi:hypothetical protein Tco_0414081 [Tanacetum coccineum]